MNINKTFVGSKMNKSLDERLIPNGEYIDAMNIRVSSDEDGEAGSVENAKGNYEIATLQYEGSNLVDASTIGVYEDGSNETIYWFVTSKDVDMIVSYNTVNQVLVYHVVSETVLNFSKQHRINGVNLIDDLLFFTDNYNPPRRINVKHSYPQPALGVDQITEDDISVIVKPPVSAPGIELIKNSNNNNYIEDKFIRFAYRYKYKNGEYSALSEFSDVAFQPGVFSLDYGNYDMIGMKNIKNTVNVSFNTGSDRVVGIDLCFKQSNSNVINVIDRFNKEDEGWSDNDVVSIEFNNQKIYTTLSGKELLRRFDNVPKLAKSQASLGNRIFYGNYVDGYDIDTIMNYDVSLKSVDIGYDKLIDSTSDGDYNIEGSTETINQSVLTLDFTDRELIQGASFFVDFNIVHSSFSDPSGTYDYAPENGYDETFQFILPRDYTSVEDLATDQDFIDAIHSDLAFADSDQGYSLTDLFYDSIIPKTGWSKIGGGVDSDTGDFEISYTSTTISIQIPAIKYEDDSSPGVFAYEYFYNSSTTASIVDVSSNSSLHSDRDYEVGIEYMDEYNRCTTTLVDSYNTVYVPAQNSVSKNDIEVTIHNQPPSWATRYRLLMKPSKLGYEVIYSNYYFYDSSDGAWWLLLEGDNQTKCKVGDTLYVKSDSNGATLDVVKTKVLEIESQERNFISGDILTPPGLYMKLKPSNFSIEEAENPVITRNQIARRGSYPSLFYPTYIEDPDNPGSYMEFAVPAGSKVSVRFKDKRNGRGSSCGSRTYIFKKDYVATQDYDNMYDFLIGENFDPSDPTNSPGPESSDDTTPTAEFIDTINSTSFLFGGDPLGAAPSDENGVTRIQYVRGNTGSDAEGRAWLAFRSGNKKCNGHRGKIYVTIEAFIAGEVLIFETEALENESEIFFEGHKSYPIVGGYHTGDIQNQDGTNPAVVSLDMYNCYSFGNGAESYKIGDSLATPGLNIGERTSSVSEQDYKEAHRYADVTYSGIYNEDTNINKLNEFNLGLANYKTLEKSFGPINKLHGRQTDLLVLQEDKVSYLLAGKNLLSDAVGGGTLTSIPEVLGNQISRVEEFGISNDSESFASYGYDIFFTDSKRGAVINIKGSSYSNDQLDVVSRYGMRSWFRDTFTSYQDNIKIGGYDPYSQEYVLSFSDDTYATEVQEIECGMNINQSGSTQPVTYNVTTYNGLGDVNISYSVTSGSPNVNVRYNGSTVINQLISGSGTLTFDKDIVGVSEYTITITPNGSTYSITPGCLERTPLTIVKIVKNIESMAGQTIHNEFSWSYNGFNSENSVDYINFNQGPISLYQVVNGYESSGLIPFDGATVTMRYSKEEGDTAIWDYDKFKYLVSDTLYTEDDLSTLNGLLTDVTGVENPSEGVYEGSFTYSNPSDHQYLYLVWDYVEPVLECSDTLEFDGGQGVYEAEINLGVNTGAVTLTFDSVNVPDRFQIEYDGGIVADSLFVGDDLPNTTYENEIKAASTLPKYVWDGDQFAYVEDVNVSFTADDVADGTIPRPTSGDGSVGDQIGVVGGYPSGTPDSADGNVKLTFNKTTSYPQTAKIIVTGVNTGTAWYLENIQCPSTAPVQYITPDSFYRQTWIWQDDVDPNAGGQEDIVIIYYGGIYYSFIGLVDDLGSPILLSSSNYSDSDILEIYGAFEAAYGATIINKVNLVNLDSDEYLILDDI